MKAASDYLWEQIINHVSLFYPSFTLDLIKNSEIVFVPFGDATQLRKSVIAIPTDIPTPLEPNDPYQVEFNGTCLTLWNRIVKPSGSGWKCLPDCDNPLWYCHRSGTILPAYNIFRNLFDLLTLREEKEIHTKDKFDRFPAEASPRYHRNLMEVPVFNEAVAALIAACEGIKKGGTPYFRIENNPAKVYLILSHDCDILLGNDVITQAIRAFRIIQPVFKGHLPKLINGWWLLRNAFKPKSFYFNDVLGLIEVEREYGYTSTFYMLNGTKGRYGARSGTKVISQINQVIPKNWPRGMHYNYDTLLDKEKFSSQKKEIENILQQEINCGRAHYLRFNSLKSWNLWAKQGIYCDESLGFPLVGYRCGIAGVFMPFDTDKQTKIELFEVPLIIMDGSLVEQYPRDPVGACEKLIAHLSCLGGALSILWHPGQFNNPEFPEFIGLYRRILDRCRKYTFAGTSGLGLINNIL